MVFEITPADASTGWRWALITSAGPLCESLEHFESEKDVRSGIARAKKTMSAARYAKVEKVDR